MILKLILLKPDQNLWPILPRWLRCTEVIKNDFIWNTWQLWGLIFFYVQWNKVNLETPVEIAYGPSSLTLQNKNQILLMQWLLSHFQTRSQLSQFFLFHYCQLEDSRLLHMSTIHGNNMLFSLSDFFICINLKFDGNFWPSICCIFYLVADRSRFFILILSLKVYLCYKRVFCHRVALDL